MNINGSDPLDIILVNTPQYDYSEVEHGSYASLPPLGLASLATWLDHRGIKVALLDGDFHGLTPARIASLLDKSNARYVGLNLFTPSYGVAAKILQNLDLTSQIVVGGAHAQAMGPAVLNDPRMEKVDCLVLGDAEFKLEAVLKDHYDVGDIPGLIFRDGKDIRINPDAPRDPCWTPVDLDKLPFIDRRFLNNDPFFSEGRIEANIIASRGCPFNCSFCAGSYETRRDGPRRRTPGSIVQEIQSLHTNLNVTAIRFVDDLLLVNGRHMREFASAMLESDLSDSVAWQANAMVSLISKIPDDTLALLAKSGCRQISLGIESGSQRILDYVAKRITPNDARLVVRRLSEHGIRASGYFIIGFPGESREEMLGTIDLFHELREISRRAVGDRPLATFRGNIFEFRPFPGTREWARLTSSGFTAAELLEGYRPVVIGDLDERMKRRWTTGLRFSEISAEEIQCLIRGALEKQNRDLEAVGGMPEFAWNNPGRGLFSVEQKTLLCA